MAQIFDRSSNALARASLVLTGLITIALGVTLNELQRSPWVTRQGQRPDQPVPFSHKHHVQGLGIPVSVLPCDCGKVELRRNPSYKNLHQLPRTNMDQRPTAGAGAFELGYGAVAAVDQGSRPAGLCLLQPRDSRE